MKNITNKVIDLHAIYSRILANLLVKLSRTLVNLLVILVKILVKLTLWGPWGGSPPASPRARLGRGNTLGRGSYAVGRHEI